MMDPDLIEALQTILDRAEAGELFDRLQDGEGYTSEELEVALETIGKHVSRAVFLLAN